MEQIITSNRAYLNMYGKQSKLPIKEPEAPTPKICPICQQKMFPRLFNRRIMYIHQCQARLKSGKAISKKLKY